MSRFFLIFFSIFLQKTNRELPNLEHALPKCVPEWPFEIGWTYLISYCLSVIVYPYHCFISQLPVQTTSSKIWDRYRFPWFMCSWLRFFNSGIRRRDLCAKFQPILCMFQFYRFHPYPGSGPIPTQRWTHWIFRLMRSRFFPTEDRSFSGGHPNIREIICARKECNCAVFDCSRLQLMQS